MSRESANLRTTATVYRAWWEQRDGWDGALTYATADTARVCASADYVRDEYPPGETPLTLRWATDDDGGGEEMWELLDGGEATGVEVYAERVLGHADGMLPADLTAHAHRTRLAARIKAHADAQRAAGDEGSSREIRDAFYEAADMVRRYTGGHTTTDTTTSH